MAKKPLMLKEYLELDSSSESFHRGPTPQRANSVTVRCLLATELRGCGADSSPRLGLSRSKGALRRLSAVISAITILQSPSADSPSAATGGWRGSPARRLTRTFSKKLRLGFSKKSVRQGREGKESKVLLKDIVWLRSFGEEAVERGSFSYPSPVVSSCSSSFDDGDSTGSQFMLSSAASSALFEIEKHESPPMSPRPDLSPIPNTQKEMLGGVDEKSSALEPKENSGEAMYCPSEEEKEQLSPVAVMDFPYQDDDDDVEVELPSPTSLCFPQNNTNIERTKNQLLQKIRRFESLAELHPVDLDHRFTCVAESTFHVAVVEEEGDAGSEEDEGERRRSACALLRRLNGGEPFPAWDEKLLFDFFVDELFPTGRKCRRGTKSGSAGDEELLRAARGWVHCGGGAQKNDDAVVFGEMERAVGWRRCEEEEEMVGAEMAGGLVAWLVEELVDDLV